MLDWLLYGFTVFLMIYVIAKNDKLSLLEMKIVSKSLPISLVMFSFTTLLKNMHIAYFAFIVIIDFIVLAVWSREIAE